MKIVKCAHEFPEWGEVNRCWSWRGWARLWGCCWQITWYGGRCWAAAPDFNCFQNPAKYQPQQPRWYQRSLGEIGRKCGNVANSWYEVLAANILLPRLGMSKKRRVYLLPAVRVDKVAELLVIWGFGARGLRRDVSTRLMSESYLNITGRTLVCKNSQCKRFLPTFYRAFIFHFSQQIAKKTFRKTDS